MVAAPYMDGGELRVNLPAGDVVKAERQRWADDYELAEES